VGRRDRRSSRHRATAAGPAASRRFGAIGPALRGMPPAPLTAAEFRPRRDSEPTTELVEFQTNTDDVASFAWLYPK